MINPKITGNYISLSPLVNTMGAGLPLDWANVFGRNALIEVEIGFGLGDFLVRAALQCPEKNIIGIESLGNRQRYIVLKRQNSEVRIPKNIKSRSQNPESRIQNKTIKEDNNKLKNA